LGSKPSKSDRDKAPRSSSSNNNNDWNNWPTNSTNADPREHAGSFTGSRDWQAGANGEIANSWNNQALSNDQFTPKTGETSGSTWGGPGNGNYDNASNHSWGNNNDNNTGRSGEDWNGSGGAGLSNNNDGSYYTGNGGNGNENTRGVGEYGQQSAGDYGGDADNVGPRMPGGWNNEADAINKGDDWNGAGGMGLANSTRGRYDTHPDEKPSSSSIW
jgi:hypothetical protein